MRRFAAGLFRLLLCVVFALNLFAQSPIHFRDASRELGMPSTKLPVWERWHLWDSVAGGIGLFDCDNDGRLDMVVVNDTNSERYLKGDGGELMVTLYHQEKNGKFVDITKAAGLTHRGWGMGVAVADYDNDGLLDLYVTGYGGNALYHNLGNCKFEDVTEKMGVAGGGFSTGAAWADYDRDGKVDLFVARYAHEDIRHPLPIPDKYKGVPVEGPWARDGEPDLLFHNLGNKPFEEVSKKAGVSEPNLLGLGAVWADYDNDGWPDLYVANDSGPQLLYHNNHDGTFEELGLALGVALASSGQVLGSMGVDFGDFDRDGKLDIFVTNFEEKDDNLYHNEGSLGFNDIAGPAKVAGPSHKLMGWGAGFVDFDNDGLPDMLAANGHIFPQYDAVPGESFAQPFLLYYNKGNRTFDEIATQAGLNDVLLPRRGAAFGDINNDGNIDMVVYNMGGPPTIFLNETKNSNHRAMFQLIGTKSNRAAIGARITAHVGKISMIEEVRGGSGYLSQNDLRLHFGLGASTVIDSIDITWPNGNHETLSNIPADAIYTIVEGEGKIKSKIPLPVVSAAKK